MKWTDPKRITIPIGMYRVTRGKVRKGDLIYTDPNVTFRDDPSYFLPVKSYEIGTMVSMWWLIIRKIPATKI